ncbi:hypothetical protein [Pantoea agglomerans]|uniref:hypothetical protein n=1 Tax=Enterobacter agglomerans TaxID=549 RepID=UPI000B175CF0|nr:hypothetical protein [Pantoea agglomerans]
MPALPASRERGRISAFSWGRKRQRRLITAAAAAPPRRLLSLRLRFLSPGRCLTVFSLCFLLLLIHLLCCSCYFGFLTLKVKGMNSLMAPSGSPSLPGRQPYCANRQSR